VLDDDEDYTDNAVPDDEFSEDELRDASRDEEALTGHAEPAPIEKFHRTSVGMMLAAGMLGLRDVLETPKDNTPAIVEEWAGGEPFEEPIVLRLDPDHPEDSIVMIRPRLMRKPPDQPPA
jgi:hypothetical protein